MRTLNLNCGESGTTVRLSMSLVSMGVVGEGIFVFDGQGKLPQRGYQETVDHINRDAFENMRQGVPVTSMAMPANLSYHLPVRIYVGEEAVKNLAAEIMEGRYNNCKGVLTELKL